MRWRFSSFPPIESFANRSVNDALDYSKTEIGEMRMEARAASLPKTLLEVMQIMQSAYRSPKGEAVGDVILRLEVDKSIEIAPVLADEARIRQVGGFVLRLLVQGWGARDDLPWFYLTCHYF